MLEEQGTSLAFEALKELEKLSDTSDVLYPHINKFIAMIDSEKYVLRIRGFRLFCRQTKWDKDCMIDRNLGSALKIPNDEKPTAVRQALAALQVPAAQKRISARKFGIGWFTDIVDGLLLATSPILFYKTACYGYKAYMLLCVACGNGGFSYNGDNG